jgi:hypothetical protein
MDDACLTHPQTLSFLNFISFYIQYEEVHVSSIVVILSNNKSLTHNNFDHDYKGGVLVP